MQSYNTKQDETLPHRSMRESEAHEEQLHNYQWQH